MSRQEAEQLEDALRQMALGGSMPGPAASLVQTARELSVLASPPPPAPLGLAPGRSKYLAEAARLRAKKASHPGRLSRLPQAVRLGVALGAVLLVFGVLFGASQAVASSLPGSPLYGLKLLAENARLALTADPQARASLLRSHAEERLDEILALLDRARAPDYSVVDRAEKQWALALAAAGVLKEPDARLALHELAMAIERRQPALQSMAGTDLQSPLRELLRELERVRREAHLGQGEPDGQEERQRRSGEPADATDLPVSSRTPLPARTSQPTTQPAVTPNASQTPYRTAAPSQTPVPSHTPLQTARPSGLPLVSQTPQPLRTPAQTAVRTVTPQAPPTPKRSVQPNFSPPGPQTPAITAAPSSAPQGQGGGSASNH